MNDLEQEPSCVDPGEVGEIDSAMAPWYRVGTRSARRPALRRSRAAARRWRSSARYRACLVVALGIMVCELTVSKCSRLIWATFVIQESLSIQRNHGGRIVQRVSSRLIRMQGTSPSGRRPRHVHAHVQLRPGHGESLDASQCKSGGSRGLHRWGDLPQSPGGWMGTCFSPVQVLGTLVPPGEEVSEGRGQARERS